MTYLKHTYCVNAKTSSISWNLLTAGIACRNHSCGVNRSKHVTKSLKKLYNVLEV